MVGWSARHLCVWTSGQWLWTKSVRRSSNHFSCLSSLCEKQAAQWLWTQAKHREETSDKKLFVLQLIVCQIHTYWYLNGGPGLAISRFQDVRSSSWDGWVDPVQGGAGDLKELLPVLQKGQAGSPQIHKEHTIYQTRCLPSSRLILRSLRSLRSTTEKTWTRSRLTWKK